MVWLRFLVDISADKAVAMQNFFSIATVAMLKMHRWIHCT